MARIDVVLSPHLYSVYEKENTVVVVIDVLRATSAICTAFEYGVKRIIPVSTLFEARQYKNKGYLVGAERNGQTIEGFDFGNSPYHYMCDTIKDRTVVLTTTNGTIALDMAKDACCVVVGAFTNFSALCRMLTQKEKDVQLLCAGWKNRFNIEDTLFAGAVANRLSQEPLFDILADSALAAKYLYRMAYKNPYMILRNSSHRRRLSRLNLKKDIKYCLQLDKTDVVPVLEHGFLVSDKVKESSNSGI